MSPRVALISFVLVASVASAQDRPPRSQDQATAAFIARKTEEQRVHQLRSLAPNELRDLNGLVRAVNMSLPAPSIVDNAAQVQVIRDLFVVDIAQTLDRNGFKAGDLRSRADKGASIISSAANVLRGGASIEDQVALADTVVVARVVSTDGSASADDGHLSTITLEVTREVKMPAGLKAPIQLRRRSGSADGHNLQISNEVPLVIGDEYLIVASRARYLADFAKNRSQCKDCVVENVPVLKVEGGIATSTAGDAYRVSLSSL